ncbi:short-chain dehydrogenase/reductase [Sphingobium sp. BS19]|uniref:short-chain dehydrogenase/reductase n=1 Tax=Sphingobium sp. BS19 TaxID=3018973 RepID=UPI0022EF1422|nr:short-chain dehydrogenase/reductase [Sphingobium sp. BS19]GLI96677.1 short-chain dehydrogenase/reductase [Sphingobium sp. BS19]
MDLQLRGKHAVVTGASQGIGLAVATLLAEEGCDLTLVARNRTSLQNAADQIAAVAHAVPRLIVADLSLPGAIDELAKEVTSLDILVNNAGAIPPGGLLDISSERWRAAWDLKVYGYIDLTRSLYTLLTVSRGVVVNIIGTAGERPDPSYIAGAAGNSALMAFTKGMAKGAAVDGVRVVGINPGPVRTERIKLMLRNQAERKLGDAERWPELVANMPFGRMAEPQEIAQAVAFLASPLSAYTSGAILTIDGGGA